MHFKVAIAGLGKEIYNNRNECTIADIVDQNEELLAKAASEFTWLTFNWVTEGQTWKDSAVTYISYFYDYKMRSFSYNAGEDYELSYAITRKTAIDEKYLKTVNDALSKTGVIHADSVAEGYKITVKYSLDGSQGHFAAEGTYIVVKSDNTWRLFRIWNLAKLNNDYSGLIDNVGQGLYWDDTLQKVLSKAWHP